MANIACSTAESVINSAQAFGCKSIREQELAIIGYLALISEGVGNAPGGEVTTSPGGPQTATGTISSTNGNRISFLIQNQATTVLYLLLGTGAAANNYHYVLSACTSAADGKGGALSFDGYTGPISVFAAAPSYSFMETVATA